MKRRLLALPAMAFAVLVGELSGAAGLSGTAGAAHKASHDPYNVFVLAALTGPVAEAAKAQVAGLKASAKVLNQHGGIDGHRVSISVVDDQGSASQAVSLLQERLSSGTTPDFVYPGSTSSETLALLPILTQQKIFDFTSTSAEEMNDPAKYPYTFSINGNNGTFAQSLVKQLKKAKIKKVGIFTSNDAYGQSIGSVNKSALQRAGFQVVSGSFNPTDLDLSPQLGKMQSENPQFLYADTFGTAAGHILQARTKIGWNVPMSGGGGMASSGVATLVPKSDLEGVQLEIFRVAERVPPAKQSKAFKTFYSALGKQGSISQPLNIYSGAYDTLQLVALAAKQSGSISAAKVSKALERLKTPKNPTYVTYTHLGLSPKNHFVTGRPSDFVFVPAGPTKGGLYAAPSS